MRPKLAGEITQDFERSQALGLIKNAAGDLDSSGRTFPRAVVEGGTFRMNTNLCDFMLNRSLLAWTITSLFQIVGNPETKIATAATPGALVNFRF